MLPIYPFAAIVGQDTLKRALLLCAVNPSLSGVLVRGDKGTAKSTAARGLRELLVPIERVPGCPYNCAPGASLGQCEACSAIEPSSARTAVSSPVPFINLPLGATEDRVLGSLDLERVLKDGKRAFQPGLLAAAHRGILYIDEVNLLPDHLVDALLDVAAMGQHTIEREGLSISHPAHITLIGTMNAEEGDLRPQLLDRFAMMVEVSAPDIPAIRTEVVRRRLAFDADPHAFSTRWAPQTQALRDQVVAAQALLPRVHLPDSLLDFVSTLCCDLGAASLRADITLNKVAQTHAALEGRDVVNVDDIAAAAELVLPHRRRRKPFEQPGLDRDRLDEAIRRARETAPDSESESGQASGDGREHTDADSSQGEGDAAGDSQPSRRPDASDSSHRNGAHGAGSDPRDESTSRFDGDRHAQNRPYDNEVEGRDHTGGEPQMRSNGADRASHGEPNDDDAAGRRVRPTVFGIGESTAAPTVKIATRDEGGAEGRRSVAASASRGAYTHAVTSDRPAHLAVDATLRHAILREPGQLHVTRDDLHDKVLTGKQGHLILLVVDASGSMAARRRMEAVKGCVLGLLEDAYRRRDEVGVIAFRGDQAELVLPPTRNVELAQRALQDMPTGGRTPLAQALELSATVLARATASYAGKTPSASTQLKPLLVLLTDGRANVALAASDKPADPWRQTLDLADHLAQARVHALVLDTEQGVVRLERAKAIAEAMHAEYRRLDDWSAQTLAITIQERLQ
ncbi:magnesium chelatase subunit D [Pararobbsia alpina]|uniref:magnesium chelatase subunit D family protein n=1 Tax=Pararobbsia alpina TaxID=621374 RepID=UPI0039A64445